MMDGWADYLHSSLNGEHALVPTLRLTSFGTFIIAAIFSASICLAERSLTFALSQHWAPFRIRQSRTHNAVWRAGLYALATLLRLLYMLLSMTFHIWLILIIVSSLSFGQFMIEYYEQPQEYNPLVATTQHHHRNSYNLTLPTTITSQSPPQPSRMMLRKPATGRGGSKVKPAGLFIHPNNSNLARADAVAVELGLHRSTERVEAPRTSYDTDEDNDAMVAWGQGHGRDTARNLLRGSATTHRTRSHSRSESQQQLFQVGDSESDG